MNKIYISNLEHALQIAITTLAEVDLANGFRFKSALRAGLEDNLKRLQEGEALTITYEPTP